MLRIIMILIVLILLYLLMIMPGIFHRPDFRPLCGYYYAHRGLHDNTGAAPENSMAAFQKAVLSGYGIELDVQLTKDRIPVVFHDETLKRICGSDGTLRQYTYQELKQFSLCRSSEQIPLFEDVLRLVNGAVPLIIEIKTYESASAVCSSVDAILRNYSGVYCMESFHPFSLIWYRLYRPEIIRGQLSSHFGGNGKRETWYEAAVHYLLTNILCKPNFIAYDHRYKNNLSRKLCRLLYHIPCAAWTIKSQEELNLCRNDFDLFIFEGFVPK